MTDRDRAWKRLASRLHLSLRRCQQETDYFDFLQWLEFLQEEDKVEQEKKIAEMERTEKWEYYFARMFSILMAQKGQKSSEKDMLIKFKVERKHNQIEKPMTKEERIKEAKAFWGVFFKVQEGVKRQVGKKRK